MTVLVEFDSYEIAMAAYESEDYKKALAVPGRSGLKAPPIKGSGSECVLGYTSSHIPGTPSAFDK
jgi:Domain of unknown function (DUF1330)